MRFLIVLYSSATTATRLKSVLNREGLYATVLQTPKELATGGCSYCLKIYESSFSRVKELSRQMDVRIRAVYVEVKGTNSNDYYLY